MKITFSNLGAIKKTTLDLRPLTVIIGPNNSNKTYLAYSICGLLDSVVNIAPQNFRKRMKKVGMDTFSIDLNEDFYKFFVENHKSKIKSFERELDIYFQDSTGKIFNKTKFDFPISLADLKNAISNLNGKRVKFVEEFVAFSVKNNKLIINISDIEKGVSNVSQQVRFEVSASLGAYFGIVNELFPAPFLLPAERNALVLTYKMLANRRYKLLRQNQRTLLNQGQEERQFDLLKEQGDIRYPQPIEKFLDFLTDAEFVNTSTFNTNPTKKEFLDLAKGIEQKIQEGNKTDFKETRFGGKEIKVYINEDLSIDLYNASSSIKQIAPFLIYLRSRARVGDLLIIDEPEMNLHPESQAKLLEVLAILVNAGVKVLLTTHSPYFMSHLNNLISGDMENEEVREKQAESLYLQDARAFLKPEDVSAYEMRKDKTGKHQELHDLHDNDYGIRWDTLSDVSADIQQKYFEIYEKTKETSSDGEEE